MTAPSPSTGTEHRSKKPSTSSSLTKRRRPPVPQNQWGTDPQEGTFLPASLPMGLSLSDDDSKRGIPINLPPAAVSSENEPSRPSVTSPLESADHLYEYFPLSLDDWMPPVDAIYRPHVVHHLRVPPDLKGQQVRTKPKRYFS